MDEQARLKALLKYEMAARREGFKVIAGIDEAGRGPLAGPVVAAACIIPKGISLPGVNDSKQLSVVARERLFATITSHPDIIYGVGLVDAGEIDRINIYQATIKAMIAAVEQLSLVPDYLLVDGMQLPYGIPSLKIVKGDALSQSIAAASIIAKVKRDDLMQEYHARWPQYAFDRHKGYGTELHMEAIALHGPCPIHRLSFAPFSSCDEKSVDDKIHNALYQ